MKNTEADASQTITMPSRIQRIAFGILAIYSSFSIAFFLASLYEAISPAGGYAFIVALPISYGISLALLVSLYIFTRKSARQLQAANIALGAISLVGTITFLFVITYIGEA